MVLSFVLELWICSHTLKMEDSFFQIEMSKPHISNTLVSLLLALKYTLGRWSWKLMRNWSVATYAHLGRTYSHTDFARCANFFLKNLNNGFVSKRWIQKENLVALACISIAELSYIIWCIWLTTLSSDWQAEIWLRKNEC